MCTVTVFFLCQHSDVWWKIKMAFVQEWEQNAICRDCNLWYCWLLTYCQWMTDVHDFYLIRSWNVDEPMSLLSTRISIFHVSFLWKFKQYKIIIASCGNGLSNNKPQCFCGFLSDHNPGSGNAFHQFDICSWFLTHRKMDIKFTDCHKSIHFLHSGLSEDRG